MGGARTELISLAVLDQDDLAEREAAQLFQQCVASETLQPGVFAGKVRGGGQ